MNPNQETRSPQEAVIHFLTAPFRGRTYANLLYLALAFPLGLAYFLLLTVGLSLGIGLTIIWIGLGILALVFATSWGITALERWMAIQMLGAEVPPMAPAPAPSPAGFWQTVKSFLANPVTWKGMSFHLLKLPLGIVTFAVTTFLVALTASFLSAPLVQAFGWGDEGFGFEMTVGRWIVDTAGEAWLCFLIGLVLGVISLNLLNGLALVWKHFAAFMLGSARFAAPQAPAGPSPELQAAPA
ncbi:MAG TPA: sensor domain-containing protein [Thermoanaerobaculia bacterium]|nr:sensor domain-containing protein [Thermoanaerobaculia bacterium]